VDRGAQRRYDVARRQERNAFFRQHDYRWLPRGNGQWILVGPDGHATTEREASQAIQQKLQSPPIHAQHWAHSMLKKQPLILDTETTGLKSYHEVIELALVEVIDGTVLLDTLIQCQGIVSPDVTNIHGIKKAMLADAPTFPAVWAQLTPYLDRDIIIYHAAYDVPMLTQTAACYGITLPRLRSHCLMIQYLKYVTGSQSSGTQRDSYRSLDSACQHFGISVGGHRALPDAQAAREVLLHLATCE